MKRNSVPVIVLAVLLLAALVCLLPFPSRVSVSESGWLLSEDGETLADDVQLTVEGWQFHYLFRQDTAHLTVTAASDTASEANAAWEVEGYLFSESEYPSLGYSFVSSATYDAGDNAMVATSFCYTQDFQEILLTSGGSLWSSSATAQSPDDCTLPGLFTGEISN